MAGDVPQGWHREDIKAALRKKHRTLQALSRSWGLHPDTISAVFSDGSYMPRVEKLIAEELGQPPHLLWPHRWNPDGTRRPPSIAMDLSRADAGAHRPKVKAA